MSYSLSNYAHKRALIDISVDDDTSVAIDIAGWRVVGIAAPAAVNDTPTINSFEVDPGDGTFRTIVDSAGTALTMGAAIAADEIQLLPTLASAVNQLVSIVGARFRFNLSVAQTADREFFVLLEAI